jgi:hypothetical protein
LLLVHILHQVIIGIFRVGIGQQRHHGKILALLIPLMAVRS